MLSESQMELLENMCDHEMKADKSQAAHSDVEVLKRLSFVLHDHRRLLETALDIVGDDTVAAAAVPSVRRCVSSSCGRSCWKVKGGCFLLCKLDCTGIDQQLLLLTQGLKTTSMSAWISTALVLATLTK